MNFAPYQSSPPESTRATSPPHRSPQTSPKPPVARQTSRLADTSDPWAAARGRSALPSPSRFTDAEAGYQDLEAQGGRRDGAGEGAFLAGGGGGGAGGTDVFETSLGIRMEVEACLAWVLLPPAGGVALLLFEHKSDYVRFHAWQSALVFSAIFVVHLLFSWTRVFSWILFVGDVALIAFMTFHAYRDAETLDRKELPFFGAMASRFVDNE